MTSGGVHPITLCGRSFGPTGRALLPHLRHSPTAARPSQVGGFATVCSATARPKTVHSSGGSTGRKLNVLLLAASRKAAKAALRRLFSFLSCADTRMASTSTIAFDASSTSITTGFNAGPVTKTWTLACNSCSLIVLNADIWQDTGPIGVITSAKVGGAAMTFVASTTSVNIEAEQWYFLATSTGTQNISVTVTGATDAIKLATASFKGTAASSPLDTSNKTTGVSGNPSISLTTGTANDLVIDTLDRFSTTNATTNQTAIYHDHAASTLGAASYQLATSTGSYSDTYTASVVQDWAMVVSAFYLSFNRGTNALHLCYRVALHECSLVQGFSKSECKRSEFGNSACASWSVFWVDRSKGASPQRSAPSKEQRRAGGARRCSPS
jgi:hypothetical protein